MSEEEESEIMDDREVKTANIHFSDLHSNSTENKETETDRNDNPNTSCLSSIVNKWKKRKKKKPKGIESLELIVSSIYGSVQKAQKSIQMNQINMLEYYFEYDELNECYIPKTIKTKLPSKNSNGYDIIEIPIFSLVHHHSLNISEFTVKLKAHIGGVDKITEEDSGIEGIENRKVKMLTNLTKLKGNVADIEINCKIVEPPEFISRMVSRFDKIL